MIRFDFLIMRYVILILTILTILSLFKEDTIEIKQKFIVKTYVLSLLMTQQQSQSDKPLSQFDLLLLSQQQQSQQSKRDNSCKRYKRYYEKKKMLQVSKDMGMEEENK